MKTTASAPTGACPPSCSAASTATNRRAGFILEQDREIAEKSGKGTLAIKRIERVGAKKK